MSGWRLDPQTRRALRLAKAEEALARRDWASAVVELEELLDEVPEDGDALWRLAVALMEQRDFQTAREACRAHIRHAGGRTATFTLLAHCAFELCAFDEAIDAARQALATCADLAEARYLLGLSLERLDAGAAAQELALAHLTSPLTCPLPLRLSAAEWQAVLADAFSDLPEELQAFWDPVPVRVETFPDPAELTDHVPPLSPRVGALYEGTPPDEPDGSLRPTALRVFVGNLAHAESRDAAVDQLLFLLEQEALDWLPEEPG